MREENNINKSERKCFGGRKKWLLLFALSFMICMTVGGTLALLIDKTDTVTNTFQVGDITYQLNLVANPPQGYTDANISMPKVSPTSPQTVADGSVDFGLDKSPTLKDYTFLGWYADKEGKVQVYGPNATSIEVGYNAPYTVTNNNKVLLTLYACWEPGTLYTVTYNANAYDAFFDDGGKTFTETKLHDTTYTLSQEKPDRGQYWIWTEWNTKADGTGETYLGGDKYTKNKNLTLYAIWSPKTAVTFGDAQFVNMGNPSVVKGANQYNFTVKCETQGGADGIAIPMYNLIPGETYRLTFSVSFNDFRFYEEDSRCYIFGTNIVDDVTDYHTRKSILSQADVATTSRYENMMWSTERGGTFNVFLDFVPNASTMYWFWETTDIVDHQVMSYVFNNFNIQKFDTSPKPRVEFEDLTVKFATAPYINTVNGSNTLTAVSSPINTSTNTYGTRWVDYKNSSNQELTARHKNYFHTEYYGLDYLQYRMWGYAGHEVMTIPITGLEIGKTYTLNFEQDLSKATVYNTSGLNSNQLYGCAVTEQQDMDANFDTSNSVNKQKGYQDLRRAKVGAVSDQSITFQATAETMYWQWLLGDLVDGNSAQWKYSVVKLSDVTISETTAPASLALAPLMELPENVIMGDELILTEMPNMEELEALTMVDGKEFYGWLLTGGLSSQVIDHEDLEETLLAIFEMAAEYDDEVVLSLIPLYLEPDVATAANAVLNLTNMTAKEVSELASGTDYELILTPDDGYELPEVILVEIDGTEYEVYADGSNDKNEPMYNSTTGILIIPAELLTEETVEVTVSADAVEAEGLPPVVPEKATDTNATENPESSESENTDSDNSGNADVSGDEDASNSGNTEGTDSETPENAGDAEAGNIDAGDSDMGDTGSETPDINASESDMNQNDESTDEPGSSDTGSEEIGDSNDSDTGNAENQNGTENNGTGNDESEGSDESGGSQDSGSSEPENNESSSGTNEGGASDGTNGTDDGNGSDLNSGSESDGTDSDTEGGSEPETVDYVDASPSNADGGASGAGD